MRRVQLPAPAGRQPLALGQRGEVEEAERHRLLQLQHRGPARRRRRRYASRSAPRRSAAQQRRRLGLRRRDASPAVRDKALPAASRRPRDGTPAGRAGGRACPARTRSARGTTRKPDQKCAGAGISPRPNFRRVFRHRLLQREAALQRPRLRGWPRRRCASRGRGRRSRHRPPPAVTGSTAPSTRTLRGQASSSGSTARPAGWRRVPRPCGFRGWCRRRSRPDAASSALQQHHAGRGPAVGGAGGEADGVGVVRLGPAWPPPARLRTGPRGRLGCCP